MPRLPGLLATLLLAAPLAAEPVVLDLPRLEILAPEELEPVARRLRAYEPERFADMMELLGLEDAGPPIQVVLAPEGSPAAQEAPSWVNGYAWGALGRIVLFPQRTPTYPDGSLEELLRHEVAHVLLARVAGGREVPRWFNEGAAMVASGDWGMGDRSRLTLAMLRGDGVSIRDLDRYFAAERVPVARAYAVAGALVRELLRRYGAGAVARTLEGIALGLPFDEAFRRATGATLEGFEESFGRRLSFWYRWVPFLTSSATLWIAVTLLALVAIRRRRQRDEEMRQRWEEEEEAAAARSARRIEEAAGGLGGSAGDPAADGGSGGNGNGGGRVIPVPPDRWVN